MNLKTLVSDFAGELSALIHSQATERARAAVMSAFGAAPRRGPGRPPKTTPATKLAEVSSPKARKKAPRQLCPVPGCKNPAAPVFGMVCAKHKDLPKSKIKSFRQARRAKKLGLPAPKAGKPRAVKKTAVKKTAVKKTAVEKTAAKPVAKKAAAEKVLRKKVTKPAAPELAPTPMPPGTA